jgi:hypothetical protein
MSLADLIFDMAADAARAQAAAVSPTFRQYHRMRAERDLVRQQIGHCKVESELWALREIAARVRLKRLDAELKAKGWHE